MRWSWGTFVPIGATIGLALLLVFGKRPAPGTAQSKSAPSATEGADALALSKAASRNAVEPPFKGLDLAHLSADDRGVDAPIHLAEGGEARASLSLDAGLQESTRKILIATHLPEASVVVVDVATGRLLVYASHVEHGPLRDLAAEATAPSASVFKIVTGGALLERGGQTPDTRECYSGGEQRITARDLEPDPARDKWCSTLGGAMGRSLNTVFARLALRHLPPPVLREFAQGFGYASPLPFDLPLQTSALELPTDDLNYARTAAGFWNSTLSPVHAALLSTTVARGGELVRPVLVEKIQNGGAVLYRSHEGAEVLRRPFSKGTADRLTQMMDHTVTQGTSFKAFHDPSGKSFLGAVQVAGKTGTLTDSAKKRYYTWFSGFAPSHPTAGQKQVAIAVLVVNGPVWKVKANVVAREVLRAHFAAQHTPGVTAPKVKDDARTRAKSARGKARKASEVEAIDDDDAADD